MHDSSVSIADEERVLLVLEAERFFGEKKKRCDKREMETLIGVALAHCGIGIQDVEGVACTAYLNEHLPEAERDVEWLAEGHVEIQGRKYVAPVLNHHLAYAAMVHAFPKHHPGGDDVVIDVCDGGNGIPDDERERVFVPFFRINGETKGSGLGMTLARGIARLHSGDAVVMPISERGSCIRVTLPVSQETQQP